MGKRKKAGEKAGDGKGGEEPVTLHPFQPKTMSDYCTTLICGGRGSGKSWVLRDMMYNLNERVYDVTAFCGTVEVDHPMKWHVPDSFVYEVFDEDVLNAAVERQRLRARLAETTHVRFPAHMLVFEDMEYRKKSILECEGLRTLMLNGRHLHTYPILCYQYIMSFKCELRGMIDYAFFTKETNQNVRRKIYAQFGTCCNTFEQFDEIFKACTEDHMVLVIDVRRQSYNISENMFYYKASDHGMFHVGHPDVWRYHEQHYMADQSGALGVDRLLETQLAMLAPKRAGYMAVLPDDSVVARAPTSTSVKNVQQRGGSGAPTTAPAPAFVFSSV